MHVRILSPQSGLLPRRLIFSLQLFNRSSRRFQSIRNTLLAIDHHATVVVVAFFHIVKILRLNGVVISQLFRKAFQTFYTCGLLLNAILELFLELIELFVIGDLQCANKKTS